MLKLLLLIPTIFVLFVISRIYRFLKVTNAPILQGKRHCSVRYKQGKSLDIYQPTNKLYAKAPVVVFFHGGGWVFGTKKMVNNARFNGAFNALREQGYAIVSPAYTLAKRGQSPFPACVEDAVDALAWLGEHADDYDFDLTNVGLMGESAGAHIAMMAAYSPADTFSKGHAIDVKYVVDVYGPTNMLELYLGLKPFLANLKTRTSNWPSLLRGRFELTQNLFGFDPEMEPARAEELLSRFSPQLIVQSTAPSTLIIHGENDRLVPVSQSHLLKEQLDTLDVRSRMYVLAGMAHSFRGASVAQRQQVQEWIVDFVLAHRRVGEMV